MPGKFDTKFYVDAYEFARSGMTDAAVAAALGVSVATLSTWKTGRPAFAEAIERGRQAGGGQGTETVIDFLYDRLPEDLQELWDDIRTAGEHPNALTRIEAALEKKGKRVRQHLFLYALVSYNFNASRARRAVGINKKTYESWRNELDFAELMDTMKDELGDFYEECLVKSCKRGETPAIIFANKTFNKKRGYGEKLEVAVEGTVQHEHSHVHRLDAEALDALTLGARREMLEFVRARKQQAIEGKVSHVISADVG